MILRMVAAVTPRRGVPGFSPWGAEKGESLPGQQESRTVRAKPGRRPMRGETWDSPSSVASLTHQQVQREGPVGETQEREPPVIPGRTRKNVKNHLKNI